MLSFIRLLVLDQYYATKSTLLDVGVVCKQMMTLCK